MWHAKAIDLDDDVTTVLSTAAIVKGIYVNTVMSGHPCLIKNGTDTLLVIPATSAAGTVIDFAGEKGVLFDTSVIVDPDNSATGNITVFYNART
jgi:hypothetical protein